MSGYTKGTRVQWDWGGGTGEGAITEVFTHDVERTLKGTTVRRNASEEDPAYLIEQDDGDEVLKGHSEVKKAGSS